jgi:hypothetical protein
MIVTAFNWKTKMKAWADRRKAHVIWGRVGAYPTRVYQVGKTIIVARTLN